MDSDFNTGYLKLLNPVSFKPTLLCLMFFLGLINWCHKFHWQGKQRGFKIHSWLKKCWNNAILEYWNDDKPFKTQCSKIPSFQVSNGGFVSKAIGYANSV
jgi:hypothetical protein